MDAGGRLRRQCARYGSKTLLTMQGGPAMGLADGNDQTSPLSFDGSGSEVEGCRNTLVVPEDVSFTLIRT